MTASTAKQQEIYNQQGFLSALPVLSETELREARHAFSELEKDFGEYHWKIMMMGLTHRNNECINLSKSQLI